MTYRPDHSWPQSIILLDDLMALTEPEPLNTFYNLLFLAEAHKTQLTVKSDQNLSNISTYYGMYWGEIICARFPNVHERWHLQERVFGGIQGAFGQGTARGSSLNTPYRYLFATPFCFIQPGAALNEISRRSFGIWRDVIPNAKLGLVTQIFIFLNNVTQWPPTSSTSGHLSWTWDHLF